MGLGVGSDRVSGVGSAGDVRRSCRGCGKIGLGKVVGEHS